MGAAHVDDDAILAFVGGELAAPQASQFRAHLDDCAECRDLVVAAVKQQPTAPHSEVTALAVGSAPAGTPRQELARGARLGPYVIERLLGAGGMGIVYAARDPRLDRTVAVKLIRHQPGGSSSELAERLRRESKALARLTHPNVTIIYELGTTGDEIYVAMEYVPGTTLRAWLAEERRAPAEILAMVSLAGRGLAAAHAAGLVHRDFKPDNVLLGAHGAVKVTDFGLARIAGDMRVRDSARELTAAPAEALTMTGAVLGTPAYMAPEQFGAAEVDARCDQFAFCVTLYEALFGKRPFAGNTVEQIHGAVLDGNVELPRTPRLQPRVRRAILRGMALEPSARFASMDELLAALAPRSPVLAIGVATAAVAAIGIGTAVFASGHDAPSCGGTDGEVRAVWGPDRRAAAKAAFAASQAPGADDTFIAVAHDLETYLATWSTMHVQACEATHVHHTQSPAALDLRMACLEQRRVAVDTLAAAFVDADKGVVNRARDAVRSLPELAPCTDVTALERHDETPREPVARRHYDVLVRRLRQATNDAAFARYDQSLATLRGVLGDPALVELPALEGEAEHVRAKVLTSQGKLGDAEQALFRGLARAQAGRADDRVALITIDIAHLVGWGAHREAEGLRWADLAAAAIAAKGGDDLLAARLDTVRAGILQRQGKLADAEAADRRAVDVASRKAPGSLVLAEALDALGMVSSLEGKLDESVPLFEQSIAISVKLLGNAHSLTAGRRMNLANALGSLRRYDDALAQFKQAVAAEEALFGKDSVIVGQVLSNMGQMLQESGKAADAQAVLERALALREKALGPDSIEVARTMANLGYVLLDEKRYEDALERFTRVGAIIDAKLGPEHASRMDDLAGAGIALLGLGRPADAIEPLGHAVKLGVQTGTDPVNIASTQARLAQALYASGRDKPRALTLAVAARKTLAAAGLTDEVAQIDGWLQAHR